MLEFFIDNIKLEIKDITDTDGSVSYLDLHLVIATEGRLRTEEYNMGKTPAIGERIVKKWEDIKIILV